MRRRRGISLIEVLVVITLSSAMVAAAVALLHALLRTRDVAQAGMVQRASIARLADTFRDDVHRATAFQPGEAKDSRAAQWTFGVGAGRAVAYRVEQGELVREVREGNATARREFFVLPKDAKLAVTRRSEGKADLIEMSITPEGDSSGAGACRIEARLGANHRFERSEGAATK